MTLQQHKPKGNLPDSPPVEIPLPCLYCIPEKAFWLPWIFTAPTRLLSCKHSTVPTPGMPRWTQSMSGASLVWCSCLAPVPPAVLGTPICSCSRSLLSGENALLTLILVLPLHNFTTWSCPVVVSEPGFEARRTVNPLLMGYGLAESSRKGRKSQLKKASTSICLSPDWKPFSFSFALGTTRWWQAKKELCLCN